MKKTAMLFALGGALLVAGCDRKAQEGDTVVIDFKGYIGELQFTGGTAENYPLTLGSGQFVAGFEDQLIGVRKGDQRDVKLTFPENYMPGLSGQEVVFKVKVKDVKKPK